MHNSENSQGSQQVEYVQNDDQGVHLVLLKEIIGIMNHLNILLLVMALVIVIENGFNIMIIGLLR